MSGPLNGPPSGLGRWVEPVTLEGRLVRLVPLASEHVPRLAEVGLVPELWRWTLSRIRSVGDMGAYVEAALAGQAEGHELPFATIERASGRVVGSTRYLAIEPRHRRLEIGYTWIAPPWQRSGINREAKLLMLEHAFELLGALRVEFKTDARNEKSRRALLALGAVEEGTFRRHMVTPAGPRDTVYFSVIAEEWPLVRDRLQQLLVTSI